jgi:hypothetical protein
MQNDFEQIEDYVEDHHPVTFLSEPSFMEKVRRVLFGLRQPRESGEYKWARLQVIRLWAPVSAVIVNVIAFLLLLIITVSQPPVRDDDFQVVIIPEPPTQPDPPPPPPDPEYPPELLEMDKEIIIPDMEMEKVDDLPPTEVDVQLSDVDRVLDTRSPVIFKNMMGGPSGSMRGQMIVKRGGTPEECAVMRALRWLKKEQYSNGSWGHGSAPPAMTGLALLAYLAHCETPAAPEFGETVEMAIRWLADNQKEDGRFKDADDHDYSHPIAAYAACEAYSMTKIPMLKDIAEKSIKTILRGQHATGGWNYNCDAQLRDDISYMGWIAQALKAAKLAGLECDGLDHAMEKAVESFKAHAIPGGGFGYTGPTSEFPGLSGAGVLCMQLLGAGTQKEALQGMNWIGDNIKGSWTEPYGERPVYYWYYVTQAKYHTGGNIWNSWNSQFMTELVKNQNVVKDAIMGVDGKMKDIGYWNAPLNRAPEQTYGPVYNTTLCTLMLEVWYGKLRTYEDPDELVIDTTLVSADDVTVELKM